MSTDRPPLVPAEVDTTPMQPVGVPRGGLVFSSDIPWGYDLGNLCDVGVTVGEWSLFVWITCETRRKFPRVVIKGQGRIDWLTIAMDHKTPQQAINQAEASIRSAAEWLPLMLKGRGER